MKNLLSLSAVSLMAFFINAQNFEWARSMGSTSTECCDSGNSIFVDDLGNVYTTGSFRGTADFDPGVGIFNLVSVGSSDIFISKLDASGSFVWAKAMGSTSIFSDIGFSIAVDGAGNVYTSGYFHGTVDFDPGTGTFNLTSVGSEDIFISKLDASGNFLWAKALGGTGYDSGFSIALDDSGNVYTTGRFEGTVDFDPDAGTYNLVSTGQGNAFVSKLNTSGNFVWAKAMTSIGNSEFIVGYSIVLDASGNVYTTGNFMGTVDFDPGPGMFNLTSVGNEDIFISKLDALGNFIWAKAIGTTGPDNGESIITDALGNVYITGYFQGTVDFDPGTGIFNLTSVGGLDVFISKFDASGNFVWAKAMGSTGYDSGSSIAVDNLNNVYTIGWFEGTVDFDPGTGIFNLTSAGSYDIFISKLDASSNFVWAKQLGGAGNSRGFSITIDGLSNVYTCGWFAGTVDFDPDATGIFNLTSNGGNDIFIHKMSAVTGFEELNSAEIIMYPNPANNILNISSYKEIGETKIYDVVGKLVKHEFIKSNSAEIDVKEFDAGIYFIRIGEWRYKFVKK